MAVLGEFGGSWDENEEPWSVFKLPKIDPFLVGFDQNLTNFEQFEK